MREAELFSIGLGIVSPWKITSLEMKDNEVHVSVDFERGAKFGGLPVHDTVDKTWRDLNFFHFPCYVHARVPRVKHPDGTVKMVDVPWAGPGSTFTLAFEAYLLRLMGQMPVKSVAKEVGVHDTKLWRLLLKAVNRAHAQVDLSQVRRIGVDETAARRGHDYITVFVDLDDRRVIYACEGKSGVSLALLRAFLISRGIEPEQITDFVADMSAAFLSGIKEAFPHARMTLDRFHVMKLLNEALDFTRRQERRTHGGLKGTRYAWLSNLKRLNSEQREIVKNALLQNTYPQTVKAYELKLKFQDLFQMKNRNVAHLFEAWLELARESGLPAFVKLAKTFSHSQTMILNWFQTKISNGVLEAFHSVLQSTKNRARGYRTNQNLIAMSYLLHGKLNQLKPI